MLQAMSSWSEISIGRASHRFQSTRWSLVARAGRDSEGKRAALEELCALYWPPIYAFARRKGNSVEDSNDLVQGFFCDVLARNDFARADPERGRFRTFLLTCFTHFLANERDKRMASKRGGGRQQFSLDVMRAEDDYRLELPSIATDGLTPEASFERRFAQTLLHNVLESLAAEYAKRGREERFSALRIYLEDPDPEHSYRAVAARLGCSEGAVKVTVHRMRQRFRELLVEEVAQTLENPDEVKDELGRLLAALGKNS